MKVILLKTVSGLGQKGDVKEVKNGYAANYLLPNKLAQLATDANLKLHEQKISQREKKKARANRANSRAAHELDGISITIKAKADESGTLYGSISPKTVLKVLKEQGFNLKESHIEMDEHIKKIGTSHVILKINDKEAKVQINVAKE